MVSADLGLVQVWELALEEMTVAELDLELVSMSEQEFHQGLRLVLVPVLGQV